MVLSVLTGEWQDVLKEKGIEKRILQKSKLIYLSGFHFLVTNHAIQEQTEWGMSKFTKLFTPSLDAQPKNLFINISEVNNLLRKMKRPASDGGHVSLKPRGPGIIENTRKV